MMLTSRCETEDNGTDANGNNTRSEINLAAAAAFPHVGDSLSHAISTPRAMEVWKQALRQLFPLQLRCLPESRSDYQRGDGTNGLEPGEVGLVLTPCRLVAAHGPSGCGHFGCSNALDNTYLDIPRTGCRVPLQQYAQ